MNNKPKVEVGSKQDPYFFGQNFYLLIPVAEELFDFAKRTPEEFIKFMELRAEQAVEEFFFQ